MSTQIHTPLTDAECARVDSINGIGLSERMTLMRDFARRLERKILEHEVELDSLASTSCGEMLRDAHASLAATLGRELSLRARLALDPVDLIGFVFENDCRCWSQSYVAALKITGGPPKDQWLPEDVAFAISEAIILTKGSVR